MNLNFKKDVHIIYFSSTGNTELVVKQLKHELKAHNFNCYLKWTSLKESDLYKIDAQKTGAVIFAAPVYFFLAAYPLRWFIKNRLKVINLKDNQKIPAFLIFTHGGKEAGSKYFFKRFTLSKSKFLLYDCFDIVCEDSFPPFRKKQKKIPALGRPTKLQLNGFIKKVKERVLTVLTQEGVVKPNKIKRPSIMDFLLSIFGLFCVPAVLSKVVKIKVDLNRCNNCGICQNRCPTGRMKITNFPQPKGSCVACFGCYNLCPQDAVFTNFSNRSIRYRGPKIVRDISQAQP